MEKMQNLFEVRKSVRFGLLKQNYDDFIKFEENILEDIDFLNNLLSFEVELGKIEKNYNLKRLQDRVDKKLLQQWLEKSFQIIKNQICTLFYNQIVFDTKASIKNESYKNILEIKTGRKFDFFQPENYFRDTYIPEEDFYKVKDSEIWYAIKLIATLVKDNELVGFGNKDFRSKLKNIKKYNPNWENFFELQTFNPFTTNRWKLDELENNYKIVFAEYEKQLLELNKKGKLICENILKDEIFKQPKGKTGYFKNIYQDCLNSCNKNTLEINHLILLANKFDSVKNGKVGFKNDDKIEKEVKDINKKLRELNKVISEMNGYKIHLLENLETEKFSFLIKSRDYYFVGIKSFENLENNVTNFQKFVKELESKGVDKFYYLDSMTFGGFKKLFVSKYSDIKFIDNTDVKNLNNKILEVESQIQESKKGIIKKVENQKSDLNKKISDDILLNIGSEEKKDFISYLASKSLDTTKLILEKRGKLKQVNYGRELNYFCSEKFNFDNIKNEFDLESLKKQYCDLIKEFLVQIKDKKYKVGGEVKDISFLGSDFENKNFETLEDLRNYFNNTGYNIVEKSIDFEELLTKTKNGELDIFQIKSKDIPFHKDFINKNNCGKEDEAKITKTGNSKKNLNTIYFESFFEDIKNGSKYARIGADFKIRGISSSSKNNYSSFWKKEKNQIRHNDHEEDVENFQNRFKRDRFFIDFTINLNATNHITEESLNTKVTESFKNKTQNGKKIKVLSLDHGESSFLTYKIFEIESGDFSQIKEIKGGNFDNFQEIPKGINSGDKKQENIQIDEKSKKYEEQKILDNYITKYHAIIQDQKRERQVEEALKNFARNAISKIKEIISVDGFGEKDVEAFLSYIVSYDEVFCLNKDENKKRNGNKGSNSSIQKEYFERIKKNIKENKIISKLGYNKKSINFVFEDNLFFVLDYKFHYGYLISKDNVFTKVFPDQENLKEKIDTYISGIQELLKDDNKLRSFCNQIKESFDGKSLPDFEKLHKTPFYNYQNYFNIQLKQINNLKEGYASILVGYISKLLMSGDIDIICSENNLLSYGVDGAKDFQKHMGTQNHSTFIQALLNKLSFCLDKETGNNYQFCYPVKVTETNKLKGKHNGVLVFVDENSTSLTCPLCDGQLNRYKKNGEDKLFHEKGMCTFELSKKGNAIKLVNGIILNDGDDLATYNIAKKGLEYLNNLSLKNTF